MSFAHLRNPNSFVAPLPNQIRKIHEHHWSISRSVGSAMRARSGDGVHTEKKQSNPQ
jgi:hypothetical protein